jgi:CheY-like chemotaxis protein
MSKSVPASLDAIGSFKHLNTRPLEHEPSVSGVRIGRARSGNADLTGFQTSAASCCEGLNEKTDSAEIGLRPKGVLVVEDNALLRKSLGQGFRDRGFDLWSAAHGREGVELYEQFWPLIDVVLSDVQMPVLDGPRMLDLLREINPAVRLCFMTGNTRSTTPAQLLNRGALRVFEKPLPSIEALVQELWDLTAYPYQVVGTPQDTGERPAETAESTAEICGKTRLKKYRIVAWICSPLQGSLARIYSVLGHHNS